jgi:organic hydroperoxide reductase OsmC/OhrA
MAEHSARIEWTRGDAGGTAGEYRREHRLVFENGQVALGSAAPAYGGDAAALNPETLLLGSLASCHMLTFLAVCAKRGYVVESYRDHAVGVLAPNADGRTAITRARLSPLVVFAGDKQPDAAELARLHERAHANCFIANSLKTDVEIG